MTRPPRDPRRPLVDRPFVWLITWQGFLLAGVTLLAFSVGMRWYGAEGSGLRHATTLAFMTLAVAQVFHAFNARSRSDSAFTARLFTNGWLWAAVAVCVSLQVAAVSVPYLRDVLRTVPLAASDWAVVLACSLAPVAVVELVKLARRTGVLRQEVRAQVEALRAALPTLARTAEAASGLGAGRFTTLAEQVRGVAREAASVAAAQEELAQAVGAYPSVRVAEEAPNIQRLGR